MLSISVREGHFNKIMKEVSYLGTHDPGRNVKINIEFNGFEPREREVVVSSTRTYTQLLEDMGINPETAVIIKDDLPVPSDEVVEEGAVKVIRVISGG